MSKEEYAEEIRRLNYYYMKGREDERTKILKLIDEKIQDIQFSYKSSQDTFILHEKRSSQIQILQKLKKELERK